MAESLCAGTVFCVTFVLFYFAFGTYIYVLFLQLLLHGLDEDSRGRTSKEKAAGDVAGRNGQYEWVCRSAAPGRGSRWVSCVWRGRDDLCQGDQPAGGRILQ